MPCYGYWYDDEPCQSETTGPNSDFCDAHEHTYKISLLLEKFAPPEKFFQEPKMYKLEPKHKLPWIHSSYYFTKMYAMEKHIEKKLARFEHFFEAVLIQRCFKRAMSDPNYKMCRGRITREFECLVNGDLLE